MSRFLRALVGVALPAFTMAVCAVLLAFSLMRLSATEREMRLDATQNMLWVIAQAQASGLQLSNAAMRRALNQTGKDELALRHTVFLSRLNLLDAGPQKREIIALGFGNELHDLGRLLPELANAVDTLEPGDTEQVRLIDDILRPYTSTLSLAANKAMLAEWDTLGDKLDSSRKQLQQILLSIIGIALAAGLLSVYFLLALRDATQRARLLEREKAFSQLLVASSGEGIVAVDTDRRCTLWNQAAERLFGVPASKATGRQLDTGAPGFFQLTATTGAVDRALAGQATSLPDHPLFPPGDEAPLYVDVRCFPLRNATQIVGAILLISDVTERRAAQKEIAEHRDRLEHLVHARTQELDAALERERAMVDLYRNFGAMISHQFRTPLAIVDSTLQRLIRRRDRLSPNEVFERGGQARQAIARLTKLVESTLDAARVDAGQIDIRAQACDLGKLVNDICAREPEIAPRRQIAVELSKNGPTMALCDPVHAEHILVNLISNAAKYSPQGTPIAVNVGTSAGKISCSVTNQGEIMSVDSQKLFERYFRGKNAEGQPGIGIGLYMARALARMQDGDVRFDASEDGRVTFTLLVPATENTERAHHAPRSNLVKSS